MGALPTGTVTFVFTDVEGSTRLLHELGADEYARVLAEHRRVVRDEFGSRGGVEVDTQGDAFFYAFATPTDAVAAAALLDHGRMPTRVGIHTGTPLLTDEGYVGADVNLGARIAAVGHGGQVLLSAATAAHVEAELSDLGEHRLKDFAAPVAIFQLGTEPFPPLRTIANTNLPRPASRFVGREREVREVVEQIRGNRLLTLTGPGGSGKTRLAIEAASELVGEFPAGVFWVPLATVRDPSLVSETVAQTLGAKDSLATHIGERRMLLVLDNLEQVIAAAPDLASLAESCPNLALLVTSRELLHVRGEVEYAVSPLADPDATELFCARASCEASAAVAELCRRLDNMPLALELAAARAKVLTPEQILERIGRRLDLFRGGRDVDPRQQTLRATIEWSHDLLTAEEKQLFRRLGVFVGGCTLDSAETVCGADLDTLQSLVEKSLVRHTGDRFWMLETIREFAVERLEETGDSDDAQRRHAEFLLALAESANLSAEGEGPDRPELVRPELDNLRAAIDWAAVHDRELCLRLAISLEQLWVMNDPFEGVRRLGGLLDLAEDAQPILRARLLRCYASSAWVAGDFDLGGRVMEEALAEFERLGDERAAAFTRLRVGVSAFAAGDLLRARRHFEETLAICRRKAYPKLEGDALTKLGYVAHAEGDPAAALELFEEGAEACRRAGFPWLQAEALRSAARVLEELHRPAEAQQRAQQALRLADDLSNRQGVVTGLALLARFAIATGDVDRAGSLWGAVLAEEARGPLGFWASSRDQFAAVLDQSGERLEAARSAGRRLSLAEAVEVALSIDSPA